MEVIVVTEAKLQEVSNSNLYHDKAFLKFLKASKAQVNGDTLKYMRSLQDQISYLTVVLRMIKDVHFKEIIMVTNNQLWHLSYNTLKELKFSEVDILLKLNERKGDNNKGLFDDLRNYQPSILPEVSIYPMTILVWHKY